MCSPKEGLIAGLRQKKAIRDSGNSCDLVDQCSGNSMTGLSCPSYLFTQRGRRSFRFVVLFLRKSKTRTRGG